MKKIIFIAFLTIVGVSYVVAQPRAVGARFGYGAEISYEHGFGESNMLSIEAGLHGFSGLETAITYDWIDPFGATFPWEYRGEWHWYLGVGGAIGFGSWYNWSRGYFTSFIGAAGRCGVEYDFWFPLQLSVDYRPVIGPGFVTYRGNTNAAFYTPGLYAGGIAFSVRYKFQ